MQRLAHRDQGAVLDCLRVIHAAVELDAFPLHIVAALRRVVPAPFGSFNEIDPQATRIRYVVEPTEAQVPHAELRVGQYLHEQPVLAHYERTGDGSPRKVSDFVTPLQFHRLRIYRESYSRRRVEYQIVFMFPSLQRTSPSTIAIALDRSPDDADFSERDRSVLSLLRPHVLLAYANAQLVAALRRGAGRGAEPTDAPPREIIILRRPGLHLVTPRARDWLARHFGDAPVGEGHLPDDVEAWIRRQEAHPADGEPSAPPEPLVVGRGAIQLCMRWFPDSGGNILVLEEEQRALAFSAPNQRSALTRREASVLHWVRQGKTDKEIAAMLHCSHRTVGTHLARIFGKLGAKTRAAAARSSL